MSPAAAIAIASVNIKALTKRKSLLNIRINDLVYK